MQEKYEEAEEVYVRSERDREQRAADGSAVRLFYFVEALK